MAVVLVANYPSSNAEASWVGLPGDATKYSQSFQPSSTGNVTSAKVYGGRAYGSEGGTVRVGVYAHSGTYGTSSVPTGSALGYSDTVNLSSIGVSGFDYTSFAWITFTFSTPVAVTASTPYCLVVEYSTDNYLLIGADGSSPSHSGNHAFYNGTWTIESTYDMIFEVYAETGVSTAYDVVAALGTFALTGQAANFSYGTNVVASVGAFSETGQDAGLSHGTNVVAGQGSYALTGQDTNLSHATITALEAGALTLTGNAVSFTSGYVLGCASGSYTLTGQDVTFNLGLTMAAAPGIFALTGNDTGLSHGVTLNSETGTFVITGQDAGLSTQYVVLTGAGGFLLTGKDAALTFSQIMSAETGAYTLDGNDAAFPISYKINPETGTFTLTGNNANLSFSSPAGAGNIIIGIAI